MKPLFFILLISINGSVCAQKKIHYGAQLSIDFSYRYLKNDVDNFGVNESIINSRNNTEKLSPRFTSGFVFAFNLTQKISLNSSLLYSMKGYNQKGEFTMIRSNGVFEVAEFNMAFLEHLAEIPTLFAYQLGNTKKGLAIYGGAYHAFYFQTSYFSKWKFADGETGKSSSKFSNLDLYRIQAALGVNYIFSPFNNESAFCTIGPELKYTLNSIIQSPIKEYPYQIGLRFTALF